jgi:predicted transcriptional regulator
MLGELEKEIMDIMWNATKPLTVRVVFELLKKKRKIAYTTAMTVMNRLVEKKILKRLNEGKAYVYKATYSKDKFLTRTSRQIIRSFISSFGETAIAHFVDEVDKIPKERRGKLLKMLKGADDPDAKI